MEKASGTCSEQQSAYMSCLKHWFNTKFLKGEFIPNSDCELAFEQFRDCVALHFQKVRARCVDASARRVARALISRVPSRLPFRRRSPRRNQPSEHKSGGDPFRRTSRPTGATGDG